MSDSADTYSKTVLDHFLNPRNVGPLPSPSGVGEVGAAAFGDVVRVSVRVQDGRIVESAFQTYGCGTAIATSSMAAELIRGRTVAEAMACTSQQIIEALGGLPPIKLHCAVLAEEAVKAAIKDYLRKNPASAPPS